VQRVSLESIRGATRRVDCVSREIHLEDDETYPWLTLEEGGLCLARETSLMCNGKGLDSIGSGTTSRGRHISPILREKD
jgi:hypothetical protein